MSFLAQHHARRLATVLGSYIILAPAVVQERSSRRFLEGTNRQFTLQQSSDGQGAVRLYANPGYIDGYGGYLIYLGYGEEFWFIGERFILSGLGNPDGASFDVKVDGVPLGVGTTKTAQEQRIIYFDSGKLERKLHHVTTYKKDDGYALFLDQLEVL